MSVVPDLVRPWRSPGSGSEIAVADPGGIFPNIVPIPSHDTAFGAVDDIGNGIGIGIGIEGRGR